ncbi:DNA/RNA helicase domain-containing protein [Allohahella sp. A8]|uniref:DNA/RNA helicase domain-containing protein n=1 Tax=Allohahella sp. A8 TaxID=3141461 RepID=UPI003A8118D4
MLVYSADKKRCITDVRSNKISQMIEAEVRRALNRNSPRSETLSWENSLQYISQVLWDEAIPDSAGVAIEYNIPLTNRRVDFILTGKDSERRDTAIIVELKQWQEAEITTKDAIVRTWLNKTDRETPHPSYQAWSYAALIHDYNETVRNESITLRPCAYLHNMRSRQPINDPFYHEHTAKAPVFISQDALMLAEFFKQHVRYGDSDNIMYRIEHGVIKPSKNLADALASMLDGNVEFLMIDEQKLVYETAIDLAHKAKNGRKNTLVIRGGPGTGKSVVAINLLAELTKRELLVQYVSKNAAPREVYKKLLTGSRKKTHIDNMFKGSGGYFETEPDFFDVLLVDEAHRLNEKSGLYGNLGKNQIMELIICSKLSVFFIDEAQRVTLQDIGRVAEIRRWAAELGSGVTELDLVSQFRCNGSDGYVAWVDHTLGVRDTAHTSMDDIDYEVKVFDDPSTLKAAVTEKNRLNNKSRMVAGYCWDWASKTDPAAYDIVIGDFRAQWNLREDGGLWLVAENSVEQVGCIHTCQGLELDYIGVIFGDDFVVRDGRIVTDAGKRSSMDRSIRGFKKLLKESPEQTRKITDEIIKNTYRTLMTRGQKGCFLYSVDEETNAYLKSAASRENAQTDTVEAGPSIGLPLTVVPFEQAKPYKEHVPIFDVAAAAGDFSAPQDVAECEWAELPEFVTASEGMFIAQVVGESMNRRIPNGSWCLFKANPGGTRNNKIVMVQHRSIADPDHGGRYTVKRYHREKTGEGDLGNSRIILKPETNAFGYPPIILEDIDDDLIVIGEFLMVL